MSKNTRDAKFRTVDVDEYDEDKFRDDAEAAEGESNEAGQLASRESEVKKLVSTNNLTAALKAVLADPPINTKEVQLKVSPSVSRNSQWLRRGGLCAMGCVEEYPRPWCRMSVRAVERLVEAYSLANHPMVLSPTAAQSSEGVGDSLSITFCHACKEERTAYTSNLRVLN